MDEEIYASDNPDKMDGERIGDLQKSTKPIDEVNGKIEEYVDTEEISEESSGDPEDIYA